MKKGFTLLELLIVVIVIAILATFAIPQYINAVEKSKIGKAWNAVTLCCNAEKMYRGENNLYLNVAAGGWDAALGNYIEFQAVDADIEWDYDVAGSTASTFTVIATRMAGPHAGTLLSMDESGVKAPATNTHPLL